MMYKEIPETETIEVGEDYLEAPENFMWTSIEELDSAAKDYGFERWKDMKQYFKNLSTLPWKGKVKYYVTFNETS